MDLERWLKDATTLMQQIGSLSTTVLTVGGLVGQVIDRGKHLITVLISTLRPTIEPPIEPPAEPLPLNTDVRPVGPGPIVTKGQVAILFDINQRILIPVERYLQQAGIDADLIIVTNDPTYSPNIRLLDPARPEEWEELAHEFLSALRQIQWAVGNVKKHIFFAAPLPLVFAVGALMGTADENGTLYHYQNNTYYPVIALTRGLKYEVKPAA